MATRGVSMTITYVAWDTDNNAPKTGDVSNHTLRWIKDGTALAPTNSPSEVDSTNCPGVYKLQLTNTETDCDIGTLSGTSSTSGVVIIPVTIQFERLPNAAPGQPGGLPIIGSSPLTNLDASVSSRLASNDSRLNHLDAAISSRLSGTDDRLDYLDAAISSRASAEDYTSARAAKLDNLDTPVSSRLAASAYTAPDNAGIAAIKTQTDKLQFTTGDNYVKARSEEVADKTGYSLTSAYDRAKNALMVSEYTAPDNTSIAAIKSQTDKLQFTTENYVKAKSETVADKTGYSLTGDYDSAKTAASQASVDAIKAQTDRLQYTSENYVKARAETVADKTDYALTAAYDRAKTALAVSEYTAPDNAGIAAIKAQTDKLQFTTENDVKATLDGETVTVSTNQDKTGYSLTSAYDAAKTAANQETADAIKAKTDKLTFNEANAVYAYGAGGASAEEVWTYSNRTLTDKSGFSLTADYEAAKTAASQTTVDAIKAQTDKLQFTTENDVKATLDGETVTVSTNEDKTGYSLTSAYDAAKTAASQSSVDAIKTQTDKLQFTSENYVKAKAETVADKTDYSLTSDYDRAKTALAASEYTAPDNASIAAIKAKTDRLQFTEENLVRAQVGGVEIEPESLAAVWDVTLSEHQNAGTTGKALQDVVSATLRIQETTIIFAPVNPVTKQITLIRGDSYLESDGRALKFVFGSSPNLQDRTLKFVAVDSSNGDQKLVVTPTLSIQNGKQIVTVELTSANTSLLPAGHNSVSYEIEAIKDNQKITLVIGSMTVLKDFA